MNHRVRSRQIIDELGSVNSDRVWRANISLESAICEFAAALAEVEAETIASEHIRINEMIGRKQIGFANNANIRKDIQQGHWIACADIRMHLDKQWRSDL
jgi:hypothetical protein